MGSKPDEPIVATLVYPKLIPRHLNRYPLLLFRIPKHKAKGKALFSTQDFLSFLISKRGSRVTAQGKFTFFMIN
jgi:hypothetical protein